MSRVDSQRAIGAVTRLLGDHLIRRTFTVTVGKPEKATATNTDAKLNLFLYEVQFDPSLRNVSFDEGGPPPIWLVLKYLLTAFDENEESDSAAAHELLGRGIAALQELNALRLDAGVDASVRRALEYNPEPLKITFDEASPDLLTKLMQGTDEIYRLSAAVQVRPVLLLPEEPSPFGLLVGVDYTTSPPTEIGAAGVAVEAIPSLGARLERVEPETFEPGESFTLHGVDLHLSGLEALIDNEALRITSVTPDRMTVEAESTAPGPGGQGRIASGLGPSAGQRALRLRQALPNGRARGSNVLPCALRPVVTGAALNAGALEIDGVLLGRPEDEIVVALYRDGAVAHLFDAVTTQDDQRRIAVPGVAAATAPGDYLALVRVNGEQARVSPRVVLP